MTRKEVIDAIADAISEMEGFKHKTSRVAVRNANPGNIRIWRGKDGKPYPTHRGYVDFVAWANGDYTKGLEEGWRVLRVLVGRYIDGHLTGHPPTFVEMFEKYAPAADNNHPRQYAAFVATKLGASPGDVIKNIIRKEEEEA